MIWPVWMVLTGALALLAHRADEMAIRAGLIAVLIGLLASRFAVALAFPGISMMAVWLAVSIYLIANKLYGMAMFCALSAASYYPLWVSFLVADVFGVLMLMAAGGGIYGLGANTRMGDWVFAAGGHTGGVYRRAAPVEKAP